MEINEAIKNCKEIADRDSTCWMHCNDKTCRECEKEHEQLAEWLEELKVYKDTEEQGRLLRLPCKVGDTIHIIVYEYTECTAYGETYGDSWCYGCEKECDSKKISKVVSREITKLQQILNKLDDFGKTVFLTKEEAEQALKQIGE